MNIYLFKCDTDKYKWIRSETDDEILDEFQQSRFGHGFEISVTIQGKRQKMPDIFELDFRIPVLTNRALSELAPISGSEIELVTLQCETLELTALNILNQRDCLILEESTLDVNDFGQIITLEHGIFETEKLGDSDFFTIPNDTSVYITERLLDKIQTKKLLGLIEPHVVGCTAD